MRGEVFGPVDGPDAAERLGLALADDFLERGGARLIAA